MYLRIIAKTALAALIVTVVTVALAIPYAYLMVRTPSAGLRKLLLIGLFLPFFLGQVIRAYGWLIVLGKQGLLNAGLTGLGSARGSTDLHLSGRADRAGPVHAAVRGAAAGTCLHGDPGGGGAGLDEPRRARLARPFGTSSLPLAKPGWIAAAVVVFTLTMTDFAMPEIMGGGGNDFIANAIYDGFFQISDAGLGSALAIVLTALGTLAVAVVFTAIGVGTLGYPVQQRSGSRAMMRQPAARAVIWAIVLFDLLFLALPTLVIVVASFTAGNIIAFPPEGFSLRWYEVLLASARSRRRSGAASRSRSSARS